MSLIKEKLGRAMASMAECALAMGVAKDKALTTARHFEEAAAEMHELGVDPSSLLSLANLMRSFEVIDLSSCAADCIDFSEACKR